MKTNFNILHMEWGRVEAAPRGVEVAHDRDGVEHHIHVVLLLPPVELDRAGSVLRHLEPLLPVVHLRPESHRRDIRSRLREDVTVRLILPVASVFLDEGVFLLPIVAAGVLRMLPGGPQFLRNKN